MSFDYIVLILIIIGILGGFGFWKIIKKFNYELNFKESLLFPISILSLTILCLTDFSLLRINIDFRISIGIIIYFLVLLLLYYIIRSIKLKKYIPIKTIIYYILIGIVCLVILFNLLGKSTSNINGWDALGLLLIYIVVCIIYIGLLLLINVILFIIKSIKKDNLNFKNTNYKISKFSYFNILAVFLIIGLIFGIDYYNELNHHKIIEQQKELVIDYLNTEYSNYNFEIINAYETKVDCGFMTCMTPAFRNEIKAIELNKTFIIDVKKEDLTIYEDEFKEIFKEEQKENVKKYLKSNYNVSLGYKINNEKIEDVEFIIGKNYKKEEIDLFTQDMKSIFNYVDNNFCDIDYVVLNFENGNPFYEGEYEYSKTKGSINENSMTNELWVMVNSEYIFVEK